MTGYNTVVNYFVYAIFIIMPLYMGNYYADLTVVKFKTYVYPIYVLIAVMVFYKIYYYFKEQKKNPFINVKGLKNLNVVDISMLAFTIISSISTLLSDYKLQAFTGSGGRYTGLLLTLCYCTAYFCISRKVVFKKAMIYTLHVVGVLVATLGIIHYLGYNPMGLKTGLSEVMNKTMFSTIGNINVYTAYLVLITGSAFILFCTSKAKWEKILYFIVYIVSLAGMITGRSDNIYISLGVLFLFSPAYIFKTKKGIKSYFVLIFTFLVEAVIISFINERFSDKVIYISSLLNTLVKIKILPAVIILIGIGIVIYSVHEHKNKDKIQDEVKINITKIWIIFAFTIIVAGIGFMIWASNNTSVNLGGLGEFLVFDDNWGSARGYAWRKAIEIFKSGGPLQKLFGFGPETFGILMVARYKEEMASTYKVIFDNAHNEWLQYLVTIGILGLLSYLAFMATSYYYMFKNCKGNKYVMALAFASLVFFAQSFININNCLVVPIMMTVHMLGIGYTRQIIKEE